MVLVQDQCIELSDKTLVTLPVPVHPGALMGTREVNAGANPAMEKNPHPGGSTNKNTTGHIMLCKLGHCLTLPFTLHGIIY